MGTCKDFTVDFAPKAPIECTVNAKNAKDLKGAPSMIFAHGAGGSHKTSAVVDFAAGFANKGSILSFKGNMHLGSRVKMIQRIMDDQTAADCALGGRSMGARAAVTAATEKTKQLVLVSYPLTSDKGDKRDQILLDLPASIDVLFVIGDGDKMCDLDLLHDVRGRMQAQTWLIVVKGADHGMNIRPASVTQSVRAKSGQIAVDWLQSKHRGRGTRRSVLTWNEVENMAVWSGWSEATDDPATITNQKHEAIADEKPRKRRRKG